MKLQIERDLQDNILKWAQTRFWILAAVSVVVGFFGVRSLVRELISTELKDAMRASADASAAAAQGKDVVKEVRAEATKYSAIVEKLTAAAKGVDEKLGELRSRIDSEGTRSVAAADLKVAAIDQQLGELRRMFEIFAKDSEGTKRALEEFEERRAEAKQSAASTQAEFDSNSQFGVVVVHHGLGSATEPLGSKIIEILSQRGFKASFGVWQEKTPAHNHIDVEYKEHAREKAELVGTLVSEALKLASQPSKPIKLSLLSTDDDKDIRVFL